MIESQAKLIEEQGDFLESAARKLNAQAFAREIHNSVEERKAWFERRRIERAGIEEEANMLREANERRMKRLIENGFSQVLDKPDPSAELNWLLAKLCGPAMAIQHMTDPTTIADLGCILTDDMKEQIRLSDAGPEGSRLIFRLSDGRSMQTDWPPGLYRKEFLVLRRDFESARDDLLRDVEETGRASEKTRDRIEKALDGLSATLEEVFPWYDRHRPLVSCQYDGARQFIKSLASQFQCATNSSDHAAFSGGLRFQGKTVLNLIRHLYETGTIFAPPKPGAERAYRSLAMRFYNIYVELVSKRPAANSHLSKSDPVGHAMVRRESRMIFRHEGPLLLSCCCRIYSNIYSDVPRMDPFLMHVGGHQSLIPLATEDGRGR
jgi:hypothetical protein